jgi:hypothetical protein
VRALKNPLPFAVYLWVPAFARTTVDKGGPALERGRLQQITSNLPPSSSRKRTAIEFLTLRIIEVPSSRYAGFRLSSE